MDSRATHGGHWQHLLAARTPLTRFQQIAGATWLYEVRRGKSQAHAAAAVALRAQTPRGRRSQTTGETANKRRSTSLGRAGESMRTSSNVLRAKRERKRLSRASRQRRSLKLSVVLAFYLSTLHERSLLSHPLFLTLRFRDSTAYTKLTADGMSLMPPLRQTVTASAKADITELVKEPAWETVGHE
jgi:hypothetical protein